MDSEILVKALQLYHPSGKREVRLVYRVYSIVYVDSTRHQKSFSIMRLGEDEAWRWAREAFSFINKTGRLPETIKLPQSAVEMIEKARKKRKKRRNPLLHYSAESSGIHEYKNDTNSPRMEHLPISRRAEDMQFTQAVAVTIAPCLARHCVGEGWCDVDMFRSVQELVQTTVRSASFNEGEGDSDRILLERQQSATFKALESLNDSCFSL